MQARPGRGLPEVLGMRLERVRMNAPFVAAIVPVRTERPPLSERLLGMPITRTLLDMVESEIAIIEREREIRRDLSFNSDELAMLRAYKEQIDRVFEYGRNKAEWERLHPKLDRLDPGVPYPWSCPV